MKLIKTGCCGCSIWEFRGKYFVREKNGLEHKGFDSVESAERFMKTRDLRLTVDLDERIILKPARGVL